MKLKQVMSFIARNQIIPLTANVLMFLMVLGLYLKRYGVQAEGILDLIDPGIFSSVVLLAIVNVICHFLETMILNWTEDMNKLTEDYQKLISTYKFCTDPEEAEREQVPLLISYTNPADGSRIVLPEIDVCSLYHRPIRIEDHDTAYQLPKRIEEHFDEIFQAHGSSIVYNQLNIRVDRWGIEPATGEFCMKTSRTTYFDSLVTNRAIDFMWGNGLTVRKVLEYGPFLHELEESELSNHLGYKGFLETADGRIGFVKRGKHLSVEKNTFGSTFAASLKTRYALKKKRFCGEGLADAVCREILDECKVPHTEQTYQFSVEENVIAAYRDVIEGGKPQFVIYVKLPTLNSDEVETNFQKKLKEKGGQRRSVLVDGTHFIWIPREDLQKAVLGVNYMVCNGKRYPMDPSAVAAVVLLLRHFQEMSQETHGGGKAAADRFI